MCNVRRELLGIAQEAEGIQQKQERRAKVAGIGASVGLSFGEIATSLELAYDCVDANIKAHGARQIKLAALDQERQRRWLAQE